MTDMSASYYRSNYTPTLMQNRILDVEDFQAKEDLVTTLPKLSAVWEARDYDKIKDDVANYKIKIKALEKTTKSSALKEELEKLSDLFEAYTKLIGKGITDDRQIYLQIGLLKEMKVKKEMENDLKSVLEAQAKEKAANEKSKLLADKVRKLPYFHKGLSVEMALGILKFEKPGHYLIVEERDADFRFLFTAFDSTVKQYRLTLSALGYNLSISSSRFGRDNPIATASDPVSAFKQALGSDIRMYKILVPITAEDLERAII